MPVEHIMIINTIIKTTSVFDVTQELSVVGVAGCTWSAHA